MKGKTGHVRGVRGGGGGGNAKPLPYSLACHSRSHSTHFPFPPPIRTSTTQVKDLLLERIKDKCCWFARDFTVAMFVPGQEQSISLLWDLNTILI